MGNLHVGNCSSSRVNTNSNVLFNDDIVKCNNIIWNAENIDEPIKLLESGKQLGISCCWDEEALVKKLECMEARDL